MSQQIILNKNFGTQELIIGPNRPVQVIAEAGVLTFGEKKVGFKFVDEAVKAGIKLLKFQCFTPENVVSPVDKFWLERLKQRALTKKDFLEIMEYGKQKCVTVFASTHNEYDLVELAEAGMPILKLGSGDSNNYRMIDMALKTGKPVILSLGLLDKNEIMKLLKKYQDYTGQLIILHCTTLYPAPSHLANLDLIRQMHQEFPKFNFGYSDHVAGPNIALTASAMPQVSIIEKHFCFPEHRIKPKFESYDIPPALILDEFKNLLTGIKEIFEATQEFKPDKKILANRKWAHKAICAHYDIPANKILEADDLMSIRPYNKDQGHILIDQFYNLVGKKVKKDIKQGDYILTDDID